MFLSWKLLHAANYGYEFWYNNLDIQQHISTFAPENRKGKTGFERTTKEQRIELFRQIGIAVNNSGEGLRTLQYSAHQKASPQLLLTDDEATHLEDVANLIDRLLPAGWIATVLFAVLLITAVVFKIPLPGLRVSFFTITIIAIVLVLLVAVIGPHEIFKALHEAIFPADNAWFFYYQDSLMTTLMKAPDIFFAIGVTWAIPTTGVYLLLTWGMRAIDRTRR